MTAVIIGRGQIQADHKALLNYKLYLHKKLSNSKNNIMETQYSSKNSCDLCRFDSSQTYWWTGKYKVKLRIFNKSLYDRVRTHRKLILKLTCENKEIQNIRHLPIEDYKQKTSKQRGKNGSKKLKKLHKECIVI